jgi:hypothetical protein
MIGKIGMGAVALGLVLSTTASGQAGTTSLRAEFEATYSRLIAAEMDKKWDALEAMLAPNYRSIDTDNTAISRTLEIEQDKEQPVVKHERNRITVLSVKQQGDEAFVEQRFDGRFDQMGADGKSHHFVIVALSSDIWRRDGKSWICEQTITTEQDVAVDGQLVAHDVFTPVQA